MTSGQHLHRRHNAVLTWMTCGTEGRLRTLTSDPSPFSDRSTMLTDKETILQRWSEQFEGLFNDHRTAQESSLAKISSVDVKLELDDPPTREEIK